MYWKESCPYWLNVSASNFQYPFIILDMNKAEVNEMKLAAESVDGSKLEQAYLEGKREKK
jgi:hypothetical protein